MRRFMLGAAGSLLLVTLLVPAGVSAESAIHGENRPTPLEGETNGQVRPSALVTVEGSCRVARAAGPSLALMLADARIDGVSLLPDDCYRLRSAQAGAYSRNCRAGNCACAAPAGGSMHGWGKAVDFDDSGGTLRFTSRGYHWMKANAARYGWNHPRWAEPGGSECPEAWHWEWVGDGGKMGLDPIRADVVGVLGTPSGGGYWVVGGLGQVAACGDAADRGSAEQVPLVRLVKGGAAMRRGQGYWLVASDGGVFAFGDAGFHGSLGDRRLNRPIVAMAATPSGGGYWLVASDGGVFAFGDAGFHGSVGGKPPPEPVSGMAVTPSGGGYWLTTANGAVFPFGDALPHSSADGLQINLPVVGIAATPTGGGYWLAAADGGVFAFGDARFHGTG